MNKDTRAGLAAIDAGRALLRLAAALDELGTKTARDHAQEARGAAKMAAQWAEEISNTTTKE